MLRNGLYTVASSANCTSPMGPCGGRTALEDTAATSSKASAEAFTCREPSVWRKRSGCHTRHECFAIRCNVASIALIFASVWIKPKRQKKFFYHRQSPDFKNIPPLKFTCSIFCKNKLAVFQTAKSLCKFAIKVM